MTSQPRTPPTSDLARMVSTIRDFVAERDWSQFHSPKNLSMALAGEVGELVAEFQWLTEGESQALKPGTTKYKAVESEVADVTIYLLLLCDQLGVDLAAAVAAKLQDNAIRYSVHAARGSADKR